ncbi:hypothetical protein QL285_075810 [Trifolium repens]|nr:hypothetical protein QL285_075810 [Trifolium repens]
MSKTNFENIQTTVANQGATIKSLETQIGQLSKLVSTHVSKDIAGNTVDNPKEECKVLKEMKSEHEQKEEQIKGYEEWYKLFDMTLDEAYDEFMRELKEYRESRARLPGKKTEVRALCDVGSSVNVMPLSLADKLKFTTTTAGTARELVLANQTTIHSTGTVEDVLAKVGDLVFPADFMILDILEDEEHPIILGRPFLATSRALIDVESAELTLRSGEEERTIKTSKTKREVCFMLEWKDREATPPTPGVQVKIEIEELENEMAQLEIETAQEEEVPEELTNQLKKLTIEVDIRATWVKAWGRNRKVARRSKFGVNTPPLKKPAAERKEERKKNNWVNAPKEQKKEHPPRSRGKSIMKTVPSEDDERLCFATFKEKQNPEKYERSNKKEGGAKAKAPTEERDMRTYPL